MSNNHRLTFIQPSKPCKFHSNKSCYLDYTKCENCTRNPHRFDGRPITKGQILFLSRFGYNPDELSTWDFNKASSTIESLKG